MISQTTIEIVKSTAPILQEHGEVLTQHFYKRMLSRNPEVASFFNTSNQEQGTQQRALAGAVTAFALHIDNLEVLAGAVELIAQKHAALQIKAEHYPIVGENLLASIQEVLGDAATDSIINAWAEAYGFLSSILIERESTIYKEKADQPGGWDGFRDFEVVKKQAESSNITSFYLKPADKGALPQFKPGQYITIRVPDPNTETTMRNYSLSDRPDAGCFRISVKKELALGEGHPAGYVSNLLHSRVETGAKLELAAPCGDFFLNEEVEENRPLVLLAAGVGITPILSILKAALVRDGDREVILVHASQNETVQAFKGEINELAHQNQNLKVYYRYSDEEADGQFRTGNSSTGLVDHSFLENLYAGLEADYYFCGPKPFMAGLYSSLQDRGVPEKQLNFEFFGPKEDLLVSHEHRVEMA
ncbi:NO-inducible flavohemoprotein [Pseudovibrio sp. Ad26]|uniref:NO-inducible flavohemoprotein n=1 Tax=Pseudovibrio sp. Ad26 TaxID=989410 RepID=UPI0007AED8C1|nr:NO-inducible flavohemoprotein [Pseudovibrio sp. Ad26]KZL10616.1 Flavohemoprotein [Pseudovibrio sp. Ad26]